MSEYGSLADLKYAERMVREQGRNRDHFIFLRWVWSLIW